MGSAAANSHLQTVKWLHANRTEGYTTHAMDCVASVEMVEWLHTNRREGCTTLAMDRAAMKDDVDTLLFLSEYHSERCTIQTAVHVRCAEYMDIFEWLIEAYSDVMNLDDLREELDDKIYFASYLLDDMERVKRQRVNWRGQAPYRGTDSVLCVCTDTLSQQRVAVRAKNGETILSFRSFLVYRTSLLDDLFSGAEV